MILRLTLLTGLAFMLQGCVSVFMPKYQNINLHPANEKSVVYINEEEVGKGKRITARVEKNGLQPILIRTEGYRDRHEVLVPTHRPVGYWICQGINMPFNILFFYPLMIDNMSDKGHAYENDIYFNNLDALPKRTPQQKYVSISNIKAEIKANSKDIHFFTGVYKNNIKEMVANFDEKKNQNELEAEKKAVKKKGRNTLLKEDDDIKYDDVIYTEDIYKTLKNGGYIDTVNTIFSDQNNTLVLEGKITRVYFYNFHLKKIRETFNKNKTFITWYIKDSYGRILDSIPLEQLSESFYYSDANDPKYISKLIGNAVELSYYSLIKNEKYIKHSKAISDFKPNFALQSIKTPASVVSEKQNASEAVVIVKTDDGHGSGFAISNDGYLITNYHVISDKFKDHKSNIKVITSEGLELPAKVVRYNKYRDLALLKVERNFPRAFKLNSTKSYKNLQDVYTIGAPKSIELGQSISLGLISNERNSNNNQLIQLNMSINSGNSGGPLFDATGNLHGVIVSKLIGKNTEGIGFAIPGHLIQNYLNLNYN